MAMYKVEVDRPDGTVLEVTETNLEMAKEIAEMYHLEYGLDVFVKEIRTVYLRRTINED